jgi:hypothetical protein
VARLTVRLRYFVAGVLLVCLTMALTSCGAAPTGAGDLAQDKQTLKNCPKDGKYATKIDLDVSGSGRTPELDPARLNIIKEQARTTAICGGHLFVTVFSATSAATVALYDCELALPGATDNARLRRVQKLVDDISMNITAAYPPAIKKVSPAQSDITAQFRLAAEYQNQLGSRYHLRLVILTDGFQTVGRRVTAPVEIAQARAVGIIHHTAREREHAVNGHTIRSDGRTGVKTNRTLNRRVGGSGMTMTDRLGSADYFVGGSSKSVLVGCEGLEPPTPSV